ncbi:MAG: Lpg1974 family pore-forming outer membrane protein [Acidobacteriota bacterium]|nr:Lpg1974 family pore-forming outer membrane protein [Acidobacteriota bacterium]MDH3784464.1 Lpg1974 family pore-forming outer membrane protein [Acidobacteriota bacterium]
MRSRLVQYGLGIVIGSLFLAAGPVEAGKYSYRGYSAYGGGAESGFYVRAEGGLFNPRNTDQVLGSVVDSGVHSQVIPIWDDEFAGGAAFGYRFDNGSRIEASVWGYETDTGATGLGSGGDMLHFTIAPPATSGGTPISSGNPGFYAVNTQIEGTLADLTWAKGNEVGERLTMEWSLGLRYANFEESYLGVYGDTSASNLFDVGKTMQGEGVGVRAGVGGRYDLTGSVAVTGSLGVSFLDGEITANSATAPRGQAGVLGAAAVAFDDSRSGEIRDFDVNLVWSTLGSQLELSLGWEQSRWDGLTADLLRNPTGLSTTLRERDSVTFSGYKFGVFFRF